MAAAADDDVAGMWERFDDALGCEGVRFFGRAPEGVAGGHGEAGKGEHAPVRRAGRVVVLGQVRVWVRKADREHAVGLEYVVLRRPPPQVAQPDALDDAPGQGCREFDVCEGDGGPKGGHCPAVG